MHAPSSTQVPVGRLVNGTPGVAINLDGVIDEQPKQIELMAGVPVIRNAQHGNYQKHHHGGTVASAEWKTGLLCCCEGGAGSCLYGFCCPPCATASARTRFDHSDWWMNLLFLNTYTAYKFIAEGYQIDTDPCCECYTCRCDICRVFWCMPCTVVQMLNEVKSRHPLGPLEEHAIYHGPENARQHWNYHLFSCLSNMSTCPFITAAGLIPVVDLWALKAFNAQALTLAQRERSAHINPMEHGYNCTEGCCTCGYDGWWFNWCCVSPVITRNYIRDKSGIQGICKWNRCVNIFLSDVLPTWFCYWCSTCQNVNEMLMDGPMEDPNQLVVMMDIAEDDLERDVERDLSDFPFPF